MENEKGVLGKRNEQLMRKNGTQKSVIKKSVRKLVISVSTRSAGIEKCISGLFSR